MAPPPFSKKYCLADWARASLERPPCLDAVCVVMGSDWDAGMNTYLNIIGVVDEVDVV